MRTKTLQFFAFVFLFSVSAFAQDISTVAGNGVPGSSGDGGQATDALLHGPAGMYMSASGDVYFADQYNNRIRKIDGSGVITTVAGSDTMGFSGDGGPATDARLNFPVNVTFDGNGNMYIADRGNHRVRMVSGSGTITTVAGNGVAGFGGDGDTATNASLNQPSGVAVDDSGNVYIADKLNNRIRKVDAMGMISTIVGTGAAGYNSDDQPFTTMVTVNRPSDVVIAPSGELYFADTYNNMIRKIDNETGKVRTIKAQLSWVPAIVDNITWTSWPVGLDFDSHGNLYVANMGNYSVVKLDSASVMYKICGTTDGFSGDGGRADLAKISRAMGVAADDAGNVYVADHDNERIRYVTTTVSTPNIVAAGTDVQIFPNPAKSGNFNIKLSGAANQAYTFTVADVLGRVVYEGASWSGVTTGVDLDQHAGIYVVSVVCNGHTWTKKINVLD